MVNGTGERGWEYFGVSRKIGYTTYRRSISCFTPSIGSISNLYPLRQLTIIIQFCVNYSVIMQVLYKLLLYNFT